MLYIHDYDNWWKFRYDSLRVMNELGRVRSKQGMIIGRMLSLGFDSQDNAVLSNISMELVRSSEIEGEKLNLGEVRSSLARRLGIANGQEYYFAALRRLLKEGRLCPTDMVGYLSSGKEGTQTSFLEINVVEDALKHAEDSVLPNSNRYL